MSVIINGTVVIAGRLIVAAEVFMTTFAVSKGPTDNGSVFVSSSRKDEILYEFPTGAESILSLEAEGETIFTDQSLVSFDKLANVSPIII